MAVKTHILLVLSLMLVFFASAKKCEEKLNVENLKHYEKVFAGKYFSGGKVNVYKVWKGDITINKTFLLPDSHLLYDTSVYIFFLDKENQIVECSPTKLYTISNDIELLDQIFATQISINPEYVDEMHDLDYKRKYMIGNKYDTKDKKLIFVERNQIFSNLFYSYKVVNKENINRVAGFYNTHFYLVAKDYSYENCRYDYVFMVETTHTILVLDEKSKDRILRKVKKYCRQ